MTKAKRDCFAYKRGSRYIPPECTALDELYCKEGECRFYKRRYDAEGDESDGHKT